MHYCLDSKAFYERLPSNLFNLEQIEIFNEELNNFLNNLPLEEELKYKSFLKNENLKLTAFDIYDKNNDSFLPFSFKFLDLPESNWFGKNEEQSKKLVDFNLYNYKDKNFFKKTIEILSKNQDFTKSSILIYKPHCMVYPHTHLKSLNKTLITHTLLNHIENYFHFWHEKNYFRLRNKGEMFYFEGHDAHYAHSTTNAVFIEVDKLI